MDDPTSATGIEAKVFPFAEFDPVLRRDLCTVLEAVQRNFGIADTSGEPDDTTSQDARLKAAAIDCLRRMAEAGERAPERLFEGATHAVMTEAETL